MRFLKSARLRLKGHDMADISFERKNHLGIAILNRPMALNALTLNMVNMLQNQLSEWADDDTVDAVLIKASADKAFCAGGDVRWLYDTGRLNDPEQMRFFWHEYRLNHYIKNYPKPYISLLDGITMGGGVGISLHGSNPIATENFSFAMPETGIGFFPDIGGGYLLSRANGELGTYLALTGKRINAEDAVCAGLIKHTISSKSLTDLLVGLFEGERLNALIDKFAIKEYSSSLKDLKSQIDACFGFDSIEEILNALDASNSPWSKKTRDILHSKSPTSLKVTLKQLRFAKTMSMADCMKMEYRMVTQFMNQHDFYEGVRALLVDKDKTPQWQPNLLSDVSEDMVDSYFQPIENELELIG
jgi:enoyl-CoA hydratase/carnithine racemase